MATKLTIHDFKKDSQGATFADVTEDAVHCAALEAAIKEMVRPEGVMRMVDAAKRYHQPPLAGCAREIEATPEFQVACRRPKTTAFGRLKKAIGVAVKLVMAQEGWRPSNLPSGSPAMGRMDSYSDYFTTARKYEN